jgi:hypothetical protein
MEGDSMNGSIGVFDGPDLLAEFGDDVSADEYRSDVLELNIPEGFRRSEYDDLQVHEVPEDYPLWQRLLTGLRASRNQDLAVIRALRRLRTAQRARREGVRDVAA